MNYPHIKQFQVRQYKVAEERIKRAAIRGMINITVLIPKRDRQFKRYQII